MSRKWMMAAAWVLCFRISFAQASCAHWSQAFRAPASDGLAGPTVEWNDGTGDAFYIGGGFREIGDTLATNIARFDGAHWSPLGPGLGSAAHDTSVRALALFDEGSGPVLFAAGYFANAGTTLVQNVARWDGSTWSAVGSGVPNFVDALAVFDDGTGAKLYALGESALYVWDGTASWLPIPGTFGGQALLVYDDGSGDALYIGGGPRVKRYDGQAITFVGGALTGNVVTLAAYDDGLGSGKRLFAGVHNFAPGIFRWDGTTWSTVGGGLSLGVDSLAVIDAGDGSGLQLYVGGNFTSAGGIPTNKTARWNGTSWTALAPATPFNDGVVITSFGHTVLASGLILDQTHYGGGGLLRWTGSDWIPFSSGNGLAPHDGAFTADTMTVFDPGTGPELFLSGHDIDAVPDTADADVTHWNEARWATCGIPIPTIHIEIEVMGVANTGSGDHLYAISGGNIAAWNGGTSWTVIPGSQQHLGAATVLGFDDGSGPKLWVGGARIVGGTPPNYIFAGQISTWDGSSWQDVASGTSQSDVICLASIDDGSGPALYAGGSFQGLQGVAVRNIAKRVGTTWVGLGNGIDDGLVRAMVRFNDGSGPALYVAGNFTAASGVPACGIARWNGSTWSSVGAPGVPGTNVMSMCVHDDGTGPALYAAGPFTSIGGAAIQYLARWNGVSWMPLGTGLNDQVSAIASYDAHTGDGPALYACGRFTAAGQVPSSHVAKWTCSSDTAVPYCFGDLAHSGGTACPCGNAGATGHGCANSFDIAGARLLAHGSTGIDPQTHTDTVVLEVTNLPPTTSVLFAKGSTANTGGTVFGDGLRCIGGAQIRLAARTSIAGHAQYPSAGEVSLSVRGLTPPGSMTTAYYQAYYRNVVGFCTSAAFNLTNGVAITWSY